jgi:hypothetical protein
VISNWKHFKKPFSKMSNFTRHEPFPSDEVKDTYIDGRKSKPGRRDMKFTGKHAAAALKKRRGKAGY